MNLPPDHVPDLLDKGGDAYIRLRFPPETSSKWTFFWMGLVVMFWGFPGFRRAFIKHREKRQ